VLFVWPHEGVGVIRVATRRCRCYSCGDTERLCNKLCLAHDAHRSLFVRHIGNTYTFRVCRCYLCDEQIETYVHYVQDTVY